MRGVLKDKVTGCIDSPAGVLEVRFASGFSIMLWGAIKGETATRFYAGHVFDRNTPGTVRVSTETRQAYQRAALLAFLAGNRADIRIDHDGDVFAEVS